MLVLACVICFVSFVVALIHAVRVLCGHVLTCTIVCVLIGSRLPNSKISRCNMHDRVCSDWLSSFLWWPSYILHVMCSDYWISAPKLKK